MSSPDIESKRDTVVMATNKERIESAITPFGTVQHKFETTRLEDDDTDTYHSTSEALGYAMRIAVITNDKELFDKLYKGCRYQLEIGKDGLPAAKMSSITGERIDDEGSSWADGTQDIALALIDAGDRWNGTYTQEGIALAKKFLSSQHIVQSGNCRYIMENPENKQKELLGDRLTFVNASLYNFRLYEKMAELDKEHTDEWNLLSATGIKLIRDAVSQYQFIPNKIPVLDGKVVGYNYLTTELSKLGDEQPFGSKLPASIILDHINKSNYRVLGWDAIRVFYRIADSDQCIQILRSESAELVKRWNQLDKKGIPIDAESGSTSKAKEASPATAAVTALAKKIDGSDNINATELTAVIANEQKAEAARRFKTPTYWLLWQELV